MKVVREEIFGPVVVAAPFSDLDEIAAAANDTLYGLGAGIWTKDISKAHALAKKIRAGTVWINCYNVFDAALPFGGYKQSGWGREMGHEVLEAYTEVKAVTTQYLTGRQSAGKAHTSGSQARDPARRNLTDPLARATSGSSADPAWVGELDQAPPGGRLPEWHANAWLQGADLPLLVNTTAVVGFNIGGLRTEALAGEVFPEPDWGEASDLELLVMLWAARAAVDPAGRRLSLPRNGQTEDVWFDVTPLAAGKLRLRFRVYLAAQGILLQELSVDVPVARQPRMAIT